MIFSPNHPFTKHPPIKKKSPARKPPDSTNPAHLRVAAGAHRGISRPSTRFLAEKIHVMYPLVN